MEDLLRHTLRLAVLLPGRFGRVKLIHEFLGGQGLAGRPRILILAVRAIMPNMERSAPTYAL
jgi:hypothetical protein